MADTVETPQAAAAAKTVQTPVVPGLAPGDTVKVSVRIKEGEKERIQLFQGVVIKVRQGADGGNFTVRRVAYGVGVERTFPTASPMLAKVEVVRHGKVRRARLFYLRNLSGKAARIKEKRVSKEKQALLNAAGIVSVEAAPVETAAEE